MTKLEHLVELAADLPMEKQTELVTFALFLKHNVPVFAALLNEEHPAVEAAHDALWDAQFAATSPEQWERFVAGTSSGKQFGIGDNGAELVPVAMK